MSFKLLGDLAIHPYSVILKDRPVVLVNNIKWANENPQLGHTGDGDMTTTPASN
jgi:hypothetical protein